MMRTITINGDDVVISALGPARVDHNVEEMSSGERASEWPAQQEK